MLQTSFLSLLVFELCFGLVFSLFALYVLQEEVDSRSSRTKFLLGYCSWFWKFRDGVYSVVCCWLHTRLPQGCLLVYYFWLENFLKAYNTMWTNRFQRFILKCACLLASVCLNLNANLLRCLAFSYIPTLGAHVRLYVHKWHTTGAILRQFYQSAGNRQLATY